MILWSEEATGEAGKCPICEGTGVVTGPVRDFWLPRVCTACDGEGLCPDTREKLETLL